jgi:hypothetical protein
MKWCAVQECQGAVSNQQGMVCVNGVHRTGLCRLLEPCTDGVCAAVAEDARAAVVGRWSACSQLKPRSSGQVQRESMLEVGSSDFVKGVTAMWHSESPVADLQSTPTGYTRAH